MFSIQQSMDYGTVTLSRRQSEAECWSYHILTLPESLFHVDPLASSFLEVPVSLPFCKEYNFNRNIFYRTSSKSHCFYNDNYNLILLALVISYKSIISLISSRQNGEKLINSHSSITWTYHFLHLSKSLLSNFSCFLSLALQIKDTSWLK